LISYAEVIIGDNSKLLDLEEVKGLPDVQEVIWGKIAEGIGRTRSVPSSIIDRL